MSPDRNNEGEGDYREHWYGQTKLVLLTSFNNSWIKGTPEQDHAPRCVIMVLDFWAKKRWAYAFKVRRSRRNKPRHYGYVVKHHPRTGEEYLHVCVMRGSHMVAFENMRKNEQLHYVAWRKHTFGW